jgi:hypothetical protein
MTFEKRGCKDENTCAPFGRFSRLSIEEYGMAGANVQCQTLKNWSPAADTHYTWLNLPKSVTQPSPS